MTSADRPNELDKTRLDYWTGLVSYMKQRNSPVIFHAPISKHQLRARAEVLGSGDFILVALATVRHGVRIGVGVEITNSKGYYPELEKDRSKIQNEIGYEPGEKQMFEWNPESKVNDIWLYWEADFLKRQQWLTQHEWLCDRLESFRTVMRPRIAELLRTAS
ncbi:MAG: hypothetical protein QOH96_3630 [Blastocatellia bacterium]|nr:hypothetical protein [Blastocatellia bacterium]